MNDTNLILASAGLGILGALVRVLVVYIRAYQLKKEVKYRGTMIYILVIFFSGAFSGIIFSGYYKILSFLAGYAGFDLMSGYHKFFKKKRVVIK